MGGGGGGGGGHVTPVPPNSYTCSSCVQTCRLTCAPLALFRSVTYSSSKNLSLTCSDLQLYMSRVSFMKEGVRLLKRGRMPEKEVKKREIYADNYMIQLFWQLCYSFLVQFLVVVFLLLVPVKHYFRAHEQHMFECPPFSP